MSLSQLNANRHLKEGSIGTALLDPAIQELLTTMQSQLSTLTTALNNEIIRATNAEKALLSIMSGETTNINLLLPGQVGESIDISSGMIKYLPVTINGVTTDTSTQNFILSGLVDVTKPLAIYNGNILLQLDIDYNISINNGCNTLQLYSIYVAGINDLRIVFYPLEAHISNQVTLNINPARGTIIFDGSEIASGTVVNLLNGSYPIVIQSLVPNTSFVGNGIMNGGVSFNIGNGLVYLNVQGSGNVTFTI